MVSGKRIIVQTISGKRIIVQTVSGKRIIVQTVSGKRIIVQTVSGKRIIVQTISSKRIIVQQSAINEFCKMKLTIPKQTPRQIYEDQYTKGAETQMVSVRKRYIQGRYNSVRLLQRRYLELPPIRVDTIVTSSVPISLENTKTTRTRLRFYI